VCRDTIILGSIISDGVTTKEMPPGHIRGFDVRTGKQKWIFHTIPQEGEFGNETWGNDSWKYSGNTNAWSMLSVDEELGYVYLPIGTPTSDWYGEHRLGDNLYGESLLCLNTETGERVWHFQFVHHGLWDYDPPAAPNLVDIVVDGKAIKAVAQVTKQGLIFVFDRVTGKPVWPIEERDVPQSTAPGEKTSPTQPFPTKPPAFERLGVTEDDLIDFTPELRAEAVKIASKYTMGPLYTPPTMTTPDNLGTLALPSPAGGANWMGACVDPETGILYVPSMSLMVSIGLNDTAGRSQFRYNVNFSNFFVTGPQGLPMVKPPYGRITAIDLNKGEHVWQVPHGDGPRDHPAIKHLNLGQLGAATNGVLSNGGGALTKTLLFMNQPDPDASSMLNTGGDGVIRAFDKENGAQLWEHRLGAAPRGTPMTYMYEGKQYLVVAVGGQIQDSELVALALP
ncbi:MAG: PQQ-binding-like beta-propeller repeat protein, partial [Candidatus Hydrogenedentota bacterium]